MVVFDVFEFITNLNLLKGNKIKYKMLKNMKNALSFSLVIFLSSTIIAQVGIGNKNPRGLLDVNNNQSGNTTNGLVLPHSNDVSTIINPVTNENSDVSGTIAFDITNDCIKFIKNDGTWSECLSAGNSIGIQIGGDGGVGGDEFCPTP